MRFVKAILALSLISALLTACSSTGKGGPGASATPGAPDASTDSYSSGALTSEEMGYGPGGGVSSADPLNDPQSPLSKRVIYFLFDSSEVRPEYVPVVSAHAAYIASRPGTRAVLEGHADERGSREYNIALGEQRAVAVARMLKMQGVTDGHVEIVSYGEEKPASFGHSDTDWEQNRRVEFVYR